MEEDKYYDHICDCISLYAACCELNFTNLNRVEIVPLIEDHVAPQKFAHSTVWCVAADLELRPNFTNESRPNGFLHRYYLDRLNGKPLPESIRRVLSNCYFRFSYRQYSSAQFVHPILKSEMFKLIMPLPQRPFYFSKNLFPISDFNPTTDNFAWLIGIAIVNGQLGNDVRCLFLKFPEFQKVFQECAIELGICGAIFDSWQLPTFSVSNFRQIYDLMNDRYAKSGQCVGFLNPGFDLGKYFFEKEVELQRATYFCKSLDLPIAIAVNLARDISTNLVFKN